MFLPPLLIDVRAVLLSERLRQTPAPRRILNQGTGCAEANSAAASRGRVLQ
jgi:hypothetical protein